MKKVAFYTLGCKLNFSETSSISRNFENKGYQKVNFIDSPDIFIINTCSVTDNADKKCGKIVREARAISPNAFVAIIGCYAQLKPKEIAEIPGVDAVLGASEKFRLLDLIDDFKKSDETKIFSGEISEVNDFNQSYSINDRTRTFLKVQDGCDYTCSFCTIPLARGKSRSDSITNILNSAIEIGSSGIKEIVLTGVNTGDFGIRNGKREDKFIDLIRELDQVETINRLRISSIEPNLLTDEIIEFVSKSNNFVPHFHIPLQSGSDIILKKMKRRYLSDLYRQRIDKINSTIPNCCIGVDVIVGFPGETEEEFITTYNFINDLDISYLHVFTYSERENTQAINFNDTVDLSIRKERSKMLRILSEKKKRYFYEKNLNQIHRVLLERDVEDDRIFGFTRNYIRVSIPYDPMIVNEEVSVKLLQMDDAGNVIGELIEYSPVQ